MSDLTGLFADLPEDLQAAVSELGWREPMPVQHKVIPLMREGLDLIVNLVDDRRADLEPVDRDGSAL